MKNSTPNPSNSPQPVTPLRCFTGALIAGSIAILAYFLTTSIVNTFAAHPIYSDNQLTLNLASAVRTLVIGIVALASGVFGFAAMGLTALGIQLLIQGFSTKKDSSSEG